MNENYEHTFAGFMAGEWFNFSWHAKPHESAAVPAWIN